MRRLTVLVGYVYVAIALSTAGCSTASIRWSPDGKRAIYTVCDRGGGKSTLATGYVLDGDGNVVARLGQVFPSFDYFHLTTVAWTADSAAAYVISLDHEPGEIRLAGDWTPTVAPPPAAATRPAAEDPPAAGSPTGCVLSRWDGRRVVPVARLPGYDVLSVCLSPDGRWAAMLAGGKSSDDGEVIACALDSGKLYRVARGVGCGLCFTGPHRLAYLHRGTTPADAGQLDEVELAETPAADPTRLLDVPADHVRSLAVAGDGGGILFLAPTPDLWSRPPDAATTPPGADEPLCLYRWDRFRGKATLVAVNLIAFIPSPDGRRLLGLNLVPGDSGSVVPAAAVEMMDAGGSHVRQLVAGRDAALALLPAWHGPGAVTLCEGTGKLVAGENGSQAALFDVADHPVTAAGVLAAGRSLSRGWPDEMRPWQEKTSAAVAPEPATRP